ncbi:CBL-interacting protein kinase 23 [Gracilariopsis chorda]|uniref:non-specific serine/threonine protein kinase n=1 Tax=Gracilariopsis chorda TaxID=448386 RepID=A0A2V3J7I2_9FLOR|nr:CBL-interacting protein kinase 23 [Gracilariopsis chorda]|eukprot:PXF50012.1 CBL-interacting protein kinase 23 [Gracilariopsis chorda]
MKSGNPAKVGKYVIHEKLGAGGFGVVRKAIDETTGEAVAIKILDKAELQMYEMTQHVKKEISLLTTLNHPHIVKGVEVLNSKTKLFLVMEFVDGGDVHSALFHKKKFSERYTRVLFRALMECLVYCHSKGVYHRDLKLENLLMTSSGQLKVCDFGLASVRELHSSKAELCQTKVGTEDFSCPEIMQSLPYSGEKADMWSSGVILYTLLAGFYPFGGRTPGEVTQRIIDCKLSIPRHFSREVKNLLKNLLVKNGKQRFSALEVLNSEWMQPSYTQHLVLPNQSLRNYSSSSRHSSPRSRESASTTYSQSSFDEEKKSRGKLRLPSFVPVRRSTIIVTRLFRSANNGALSPVSEKKDEILSFVLYESLGRARIPNFIRILDAMKNSNNGIKVQDRKWRFSSFPSCFVGSEAVLWICNYLSCSTEEAIELGQSFHEAGAFHHVCRDHSFKNEHLYYRWHSDDPANAFLLNGRYAHRALYARNPEKIAYNLLTELLNVCRYHQQLHDYRQIDMLGIQKDLRFSSFANAVVELQTAELQMMQTDEQKISFLVNLHNMFWIHARIMIGDFEEMSFDRLRKTAESLEYIIGGCRVSLGDVKGFIFPNEESKGQSGSTKGQGHAVYQHGTMSPTRGINRAITWITATHGANDVRCLLPQKVHPLVCFLLSDSSPQSPLIRPISANDIAEESLFKAAGQYLDEVLEVDVDFCSIRYPSKVGEYRARIGIENDQELVCDFANLAIGFEVQYPLQQVKELVRLDASCLSVTEISDDSLPFSRSLFAPSIASESSISS